MNILIVKLSAVGDVIHTIPSLAALRRRFPQAHISWVVEEAASDLLRNHPCLDKLIISGRKRWIKEMRQGKYSKVFQEARRFLSDLRSRRYDLVIDFHGLFKSAVLTVLSGASRRLGYDSMQELSGLFYNEKIPEDLSRHAVDRYLDFPRYLGADPEHPEFPLDISAPQHRRIEQLLAEFHLGDGENLIAINTVALWDTKLWDDEKFARLADRIVGELMASVVFTGSDPAPMDSILSRMTTRAVNLGGRTSLRELAHLYQRARLLITTDSGPMHLAAAVGTPVVALFGPTDPVRTGPYGEGHRVLRKGLACSPCFRKSCDHRTCMRDISVDEVFDAVKEVFES
ncbi:MAG: Lipopolysaccharide heptosyltransferase 1 [Syntrophus sp. PtaU1.Bin208]|nr:MAG: Lipopolysaccharide heptosyltransferase 1 [Syntrophus sp. PtaU1.Bin208]